MDARRRELFQRRDKLIERVKILEGSYYPGYRQYADFLKELADESNGQLRLLTSYLANQGFTKPRKEEVPVHS